MVMVPKKGGYYMKQWLIINWLAILALLVAFVGGWPGVLKIVEHFRPIYLTGSIKFFVVTKSSDPPEEGLLVALTIVNEGTKNLVWRKVEGTLLANNHTIALTPKLIPKGASLQDQIPLQPDLLNQQTISPGSPFNGYLLLTAPPGSFAVPEQTPSGKLRLRFEVESGDTVYAELPIHAQPVQKGENFPSHKAGFK
jgi:hypothetical protein